MNLEKKNVSTRGFTPCFITSFTTSDLITSLVHDWILVSPAFPCNGLFFSSETIQGDHFCFN